MHLLNMDAASQNSSYLRISSIKTRNASSASGSEIKTIQMARQSLKECSEKKCIEFENGLEAELKEKIHYVSKINSLIKMDREMLNNMHSMRSLTENIIQNTLNHCQSLAQQIAEPKRMYDMEAMEKAMTEVIHEIRTLPPKFP